MYTIEQFMASEIAVQVEPDSQEYWAFLDVLDEMGVRWKSGHLKPRAYQPKAGEYIVVDKEYGKLAWTLPGVHPEKYVYVQASDILYVSQLTPLFDIDSVI